MRRNAAGQKVQAMMRTSAAAITAVVSLATRTVSGATNATPIVVTTTAAHGMIPGNRVEISGVGGNTAANGTFVVIAVGSTTTFSLGDTTNGASVAGNGAYTSGGTVTPQSVNVFVSKDGGAPTTGVGTLSHIGRGPFHIAHTADVNQLRALTAITSTTSVAGATAVTVANGGINSSTYGLWSYTPTAAETNAANVSFTFTAPAVGAISVTQTFEPTSGPIVLQTTIATLASQTSFTLTAGAPDDNTYNGYLCVVYDATTEAQVAIGVVSAYTASTKTVTLLAAPLNTNFTMAAGDFVTLIADPGLKPVTANRNLVVDSSGLADANTVKIGPTGSGTAQTAVDLGGTRAEPAQGTPGATVSFLSKIDYLYKAWRNKKTQTSSTYSLFNDDAATVDHKAAVSDDGSTTTIGEVATGP